jgi:hypothetical protein
MHHRIVEGLRFARRHVSGELGECPREDDRDRGAGEQKDSENGVRILRVLREKAQHAEDKVPEETGPRPSLLGCGSPLGRHLNGHVVVCFQVSRLEEASTRQ